MIISNRQDSVLFKLLPEETTFTTASYAIYKVDSRGCLDSTPFLTGPLTVELLSLVLSDGNYFIKVSTQDNVNFIEQYFYVFYNQLPGILKTMKKLFCYSNNNCDDCENTEEKSKLLLYEDFYKIILPLLCMGLLEELPATKGLVCKHNKILLDSEEYKRYYGRFNYNFKDKIKEFFIYFYAELYRVQMNLIKDSESDALEIKDMFSFEEIQKCLYRSGIDLQEIMHSINNLNCGCDE